MKGYFANGSNWKGFEDFDIGSWAKDTAGKVASWNFNHAPASKVYGDFDWNNYRSMRRWSHAPIVGGIFDARKDELADQENDRYWRDQASFYGFDLENVPYPIRAGVYGGTGNSVISSIGNSILDMYSNDLKKWRR